MFWPLNSHPSRLFPDTEMKIITKCFDRQLITMRTEGFWNQTKIFLYLPDATESRGNISVSHPKMNSISALKISALEMIKIKVEFSKGRKCSQGRVKKKVYWEKIKTRGKKSFNRVETVSLSLPLCPWKVLIQPYLLSQKSSSEERSQCKNCLKEANPLEIGMGEPFINVKYAACMN